LVKFRFSIKHNIRSIVYLEIINITIDKMNTN